MRCYKKDGGCPGATNDRCYPNLVWSETGDGTSYQRGNLNSGSFTVTNNTYTNAESVRCVLGFENIDLHKDTTDKLCDWNSGHGALRCNYHDTACKGALNDDCNPNIVWSGELKSGTNYFARYLQNGTFNSDTYSLDYTNALSVRCVLGFDFLGMKDILGLRTVKKITLLELSKK